MRLVNEMKLHRDVGIHICGLVYCMEITQSASRQAAAAAAAAFVHTALWRGSTAVSCLVVCKQFSFFRVLR